MKPDVFGSAEEALFKSGSVNNGCFPVFRPQSWGCTVYSHAMLCKNLGVSHSCVLLCKGAMLPGVLDHTFKWTYATPPPHPHLQEFQLDRLVSGLVSGWSRRKKVSFLRRKHETYTSSYWIPVCSLFFFSFTLPPQACFSTVIHFPVLITKRLTRFLILFPWQFPPLWQHIEICCLCFLLLLSQRWTNLQPKRDIIRPIKDFGRLRNDRSVKWSGSAQTDTQSLECQSEPLQLVLVSKSELHPAICVQITVSYCLCAKGESKIIQRA